MPLDAVNRDQLRRNLLLREDGDLYKAILDLEPGFPKSPQLSDLFVTVAQIVIRLFPSRVDTELVTPTDARILIMEFCDHPQTTRNDLLRVLHDRS